MFQKEFRNSTLICSNALRCNNCRCFRDSYELYAFYAAESPRSSDDGSYLSVDEGVKPEDLDVFETQYDHEAPKLKKSHLPSALAVAPLKQRTHQFLPLL